MCAKWKVYRVLVEGIDRENYQNIEDKDEGNMKNRKSPSNDKMGMMPPDKLESDAQGASGHNDGYEKDNDTKHVQTTQVGEAI